MANTFGDRLLELRKQKNLTRQQLSGLSSVSVRSIQNYESGDRYPDIQMAGKLADALEVPVSALLGEEGKYISIAQQTGGTRSARDVRALVEDVTGLFAGGDLPEEDMDAMMKAFTEAYFLAKEKNKVFMPRKYRTED